MAGVVVSPEVAKLGIQANQMRKRITEQLMAQQRQRAMMAQAQQLQAMQAQQQQQPQVDPYEQTLQQQALDEQRRKALLDMMQDQKGGV